MPTKAKPGKRVTQKSSRSERSGVKATRRRMQVLIDGRVIAFPVPIQADQNPLEFPIPQSLTEPQGRQLAS
jgi:hypothetical protein